jgi:hypothetical protein
MVVQIKVPVGLASYDREKGYYWMKSSKNLLPTSVFFDINDTKGLRARPKLSLTLEHVINCLKPQTDATTSVGSPAPARVPEDVGAPFQGLSNAPYLTVDNSQIIDILVRPASALLRVRPARKHGQFDIGHTEKKRRAKRGRVRKFSDKSRLGLQLLAADLQQIVRKPDLMLTLTYPSEWRSVCTDWTCHCEASEGCSDVPCICDFSPSGKVCKKHLDTFRKRLTRYLKRLGLTSWGCLWFLEFQRRGAPHFHLLLFNLGFVELVELQRWVSTSWAEIVNHLDLKEYEKHLKAGTRTEKIKKSHFGYALKYAAKMKQKEVPVEFSDIGRFWGCWNNPLAAPVLRSFYTASDTLKRMSIPLCSTLHDGSSGFSAKVFIALRTAKNDAIFTFRLFGRSASEYLLSYGFPKPLPLNWSSG